MFTVNYVGLLDIVYLRKMELRRTLDLERWSTMKWTWSRVRCLSCRRTSRRARNSCRKIPASHRRRAERRGGRRKTPMKAVRYHHPHKFIMFLSLGSETWLAHEYPMCRLSSLSVFLRVVDQHVRLFVSGILMRLDSARLCFNTLGNCWMPASACWVLLTFTLAVVN